MCCRGGLSFPAGLRGTRHGEPRKGWGKLSFAEPGPWPQLPEPMGLYIPPFSSSSSSSPMSLAGSPIPARWHPGVSLSTAAAWGTAGGSGNVAHDIYSSGEVPR